MKKDAIHKAAEKIQQGETPAFVAIKSGWVIYYVPITRVLISADGEAISGEAAISRGIEKVSRVYVRADGWTLGIPVDASKEIMLAAAEMWEWDCNPVNNCMGETLLKSFTISKPFSPETTLCVMRNGITERV